MRRTRDALLQAILLLKAWDQDIGLLQVLIFLYVCENEGLNIQELTEISGTSQTSAYRCLCHLGMRETRSARALVQAHRDPRDARFRIIRLTPRGCALRDRLDAVIRLAEPIVPAAA